MSAVLPPPEGVGYVVVSASADELGDVLARGIAIPRLATYLGDPDDVQVVVDAQVLAQEMFRVSEVVVLKPADLV